jgi:hypothetical protein
MGSSLAAIGRFNAGETGARSAGEVTTIVRRTGVGTPGVDAGDLGKSTARSSPFWTRAAIGTSIQLRPLAESRHLGAPS